MSGREGLAQEARYAKAGKRVYRTVYVHRDALSALPTSSQAAVAEAEDLAGDVAALCNVIKVDDGEHPKRVSLLAYEPFDEVAFPALLESITIDLVSRRFRRRSLRGSANPPILHRKVLLLPLNHPERVRFSALTRALEQRGIRFNAPGVGFRRQWEQCLAEQRHSYCWARNPAGPAPTSLQRLAVPIRSAASDGNCPGPVVDPNAGSWPARPALN